MTCAATSCYEQGSFITENERHWMFLWQPPPPLKTEAVQTESPWKLWRGVCISLCTTTNVVDGFQVCLGGHLFILKGLTTGSLTMFQSEYDKHKLDLMDFFFFLQRKSQRWESRPGKNGKQVWSGCSIWNSQIINRYLSLGKNGKKKKQRTNYKRDNNIIMEILIIKQKREMCSIWPL